MSEPESAWPSYAGLAAIAYVIYGVGATGPYLRAQLGLSDAEVGLHSTALAIGLVLAGTLAAGLGRRFGDLAVRGAAIAAIGVALPLLASAPTLMATLAAAALIGLGAGILLGHINAELGAPGGRLARVRLGRANVWAMTAAFAGPVVVAAGASFGPGWWFGLLPALGLSASSPSISDPAGSLSRPPRPPPVATCYRGPTGWPGHFSLRRSASNSRSSSGVPRSLSGEPG